ncbi:MAG: Eco57I restriction-modification methylase domain-containing protein [Halorhabdus sp.]
MKGHVTTPPSLAERIVRRLFRDDPPENTDRICYPGCGTGPFAAAVKRVCDDEGWECPTGLGVDTDPSLLADARARDLDHVEFREQGYLGDDIELHERDFLGDVSDLGAFEYVVGNPPYVPIEGLSETEKDRYESRFRTATGRFDLYLLFFERSLERLADGGRLSFVTPEKYEYVETATPLRRLLAGDEFHVTSVEHVAEDAFGELVTFPCITTVVRDRGGDVTRVRLRDGTTHTTQLPRDGESWAASIRDADLDTGQTGVTLADVTERISPGTATGADSVFVMDREAVPDAVADRWIRPTVSGAQLTEYDGPYTDSVFVCPYNDDGQLADEAELGGTLEWLADHRERLEDRSCVAGGKRWYAWHETPPLDDLLQPKIVFRDIAQEPQFWAEPRGSVVPKHSVYYAVPQDGVPMDELLAYLNGPEARRWMKAHCQKAHNGYYRLQSQVLADLPVPRRWAESYQATL